MPFGMNGWANLTSFQRAGVFATLTLSATLLTLSMVAQMVPGGRQALKPGAVPVVVLSTLVAAIAIMFRPREDSGFMASGIACIRNGLVNSIPAVFVFWLLLRRSAILYPKLIGAAAGTLAALAGLTRTQLPELERISYPRVALRRGLNRYCCRHPARPCRGIPPTIR